jgi:ferredoxin
MRLHSDRDRCVGAGACVFAEPAVFDQDLDDGRVLLLTDRPAAELHDSVRYAVDDCPVSALEIEE